MDVVFDGDAGDIVRRSGFGCADHHLGQLVLVKLGIVAAVAEPMVGLVEWLPEIGSDGFFRDQRGCLKFKRLNG